ncbi:MAG: FIST signal transduction protein [Egibacteraceae bacterium]
MTVVAATGSGTGPDPVAAARSAVAEVKEGLGGRTPDLAVIFAGAAYAPDLGTLDAAIGEQLGPRHRIGTTTGGVIADASELERLDCLSVWAACLPGADIAPLRYEDPADEASPPEWREPPPDAHGLVAFADPTAFPPDAFLAWLEQVRPGLPVSGGLASAGRGNRLLLDGRTYDGGAVAMALGGDIRLRTLVSQGCRPVGNSYTVTRADRNLLQELGGAEPVRRIRETFTEADPTDQALMRAGLHIGTVIDEYKDSFHRGDFLVRGVLGAESGTGAIAVGDIVRVGQTVQFHVRDARSADEDLRELLGRFAEGEPRSQAALLFTCNGRGRRLFGMPDHDASVVREILGDIPLAGFFCAGEFGPVGSRSFLHGFTASLLAFGSGACNPGETQA